MTAKTLTESFQQAVALVNAQRYVDTYLEASRRLMGSFIDNYGAATATTDRKAQAVLVKGLAAFTLDQASNTPTNVNHSNAIVSVVQAALNTLREKVEDKSLIPPGLAVQLITSAQQLASTPGSINDNAAVTWNAAKIAAAAYNFEQSNKSRTPKATAALADFIVDLARKEPQNVDQAKAAGEAVQQLSAKIKDKSLLPQGFAAQLFDAARQLADKEGGAQYNVAAINNAAKIAAAGYNAGGATPDIASGLADVIVGLANKEPKDISHSNAITEAVQFLSDQIKSQAPHNLETRLLVAALKLTRQTGNLEYCNTLIKNTQKIAAIAHQFHQLPEQGQAASPAVSQFLTNSLQGAIDLAGQQSNLEAYSLTLRMLNNNFLITYQFALSQDDQTRKDLVQKLADFVVEQANRPPASADAAAVVSDGVQLLSNTLKTQITDKSLIPYDFTTRLLDAAKSMSRSGYQQNAEKISAIARELVPRPKYSPYKLDI